MMISGWDNFFNAEVGASAALAGLIFVGLSINISKILAFPRLPGRAIQSLTVLGAILVVSLLIIVPDQSLLVVGLEVLIDGIVAWSIITWFDFKIYKLTEKNYRHSYLGSVLLDQICVALYVAAAIVILVLGEIGVYLLVPATILSFLKSLIDAWVLVVEVNR